MGRPGPDLAPSPPDGRRQSSPSGRLGLDHTRWLARSSLATLLILAAAVRGAVADVVYLYDDLGRLVRVIREDGAAASYYYDAVGNLLQITRESGLGQTTLVASTSRPSGGQGTTIPVSLSGANLIGASVVCAGADLVVQNLRTDFDQLTFELVVSRAAPLGPAACEVRGLTVETFPFTVTAPPGPTFLAGHAVSVRPATPPVSVDRNVAAALSVAVGAAGTTFAAAPGVAVAWENGNLFTVE